MRAVFLKIFSTVMLITYNTVKQKSILQNLIINNKSNKKGRKFHASNLANLTLRFMLVKSYTVIMSE